MTRIFNQDPKFPNGRLKSELYEAFLTCDDFGCSIDVYRLEVETAKVSESRNAAICYWFKDFDGKLIVGHLALANPYVRIEITDSGFRRISTISNRTNMVIKKKIHDKVEMNKLFTPFHHVTDPIRFIGRESHIKRIIEASLSSGAIFVIQGERSTGKTSFLEFLRKYFEGDKQAKELYRKESKSHSKITFLPIHVDASVGFNNTAQLMELMLSKIRPDQNQFEITHKFGAKLGVINYESIRKEKQSFRKLEAELADCFEENLERNRRVVLMVDEFDSFSDLDQLPHVLRNLAGKGLITCLAGSPKAFDELMNKQVSLARQVITLELGPFSQKNFFELFFLAERMAEEFVQFDIQAVRLLYSISAGLPYFAQLLGYLIVNKMLSSHDNDIMPVIQRRPVLICCDMIEEILESLPAVCVQYERAISHFINKVPNGKLVLSGFASGEAWDDISEQNDLIDSFSYESFLDMIRCDNNISGYFDINENAISISDPVFRQYVMITTRSIFGDKSPFDR